MVNSNEAYKLSTRGQHRYWNYSSSGALQSSGTWTTGSDADQSGGSLVRSRVSHRGWKRQILLVEQAANPYTRSETKHVIVNGTANSLVVWSGNNYQRVISTGNLLGSSIIQAPSLLSLSTLTSDAKIGFVRKVRKSSTGFQTGVFLGELRESIRLVTRPVDSMKRAVRDYHAAAKKVAAGSRARSLGRNLGNLYLEHSFGWRPIFSDIDNGMKTLAGLKPVFSDPISFSARADYFGSKFSTLYSPSGINMWYARVVGRTRNEGRVRYKGVVAWESQNLAGGWRRDWGLTLDQFVPTVYELLPYSWMVDYFSNLGQVIDTVSLGEIGLRWGVLSAFGRSSIEFQSVDLIPNTRLSGTKVNTVSGSARVAPEEAHNLSFTRSLVSSVSVSLLDFHLQLPGFAGQWGILGALAASRKL